MRAFTTPFGLLASRGLTVLLAAFSFVLGSAAIASADDVDASIERPVMYFGFVAGASQHTICGNGALRAPPSPNPSWSLNIAGTRVGGTPIIDSDSAAGESASVCLTVDKLGAPAGTYTAVFRYQAIPNDAVWQIVAQVAWFPGSNGEIVVTEQ